MVERRKDHYNLRRPLTIVGWGAFTDNHTKIAAVGVQSGRWPTRGRAVQAVIEEYEMRQIPMRG